MKKKIDLNRDDIDLGTGKIGPLFRASPIMDGGDRARIDVWHRCLGNRWCASC